MNIETKNHSDQQSDIDINTALLLDLQVVELALKRLIDVCNAESEILRSKLKIDINELDQLHDEKKDLMSFIEWHIPLIVQYISQHKNIPELQDKVAVNQLIELAVRTEVIDGIIAEEIQNSDDTMKRKFIKMHQASIKNQENISSDKHTENSAKQIPSQLVQQGTSITINSDITTHDENISNHAVSNEDSKNDIKVHFINNTQETPSIVINLLKEFMQALEHNFNSITRRKSLNDQLLNAMSETITDKHKKSQTYNPTTKKSGIYGNNIHMMLNEDC